MEETETEKVFSLRVDIDTIHDLTKGVTTLLELFEKYAIRVTFFVTMGPDTSGKNFFRIWNKRTHFLHINPLKKYGLKNLLYGILLPSPKIGEGHPKLLKNIIARGHELGIHDYDHYLWANHLEEMTLEEIETIFSRSYNAYKRIFGTPPKGSAAPSFKWTVKSLKILDKYKLLYASDMKGKKPFIPAFDNVLFRTLQIPINTPLIEDLVVRGKSDLEILKFLKKKLLDNVEKYNFSAMYIHPSYEGIHKVHILRDFLQFVISQNLSFSRFCEVAKVWKKSNALKEHFINL
ncbi:polysaccharide deacetylase family protein [Candidatus Borrarchaeum sp.]|uniref:polysaccharide deacetylase family protein n=1 Tax=Candidatus Borrarchaeum sp. TaxID=2846742 RepID=UPI00257D5DC0|nr:polysaccharide deacetylase family protein [Candidatus Borrarchaeum sp.]